MKLFKRIIMGINHKQEPEIRSKTFYLRFYHKDMQMKKKITGFTTRLWFCHRIYNRSVLRNNEKWYIS